jgi:ankyrin repeat protein
VALLLEHNADVGGSARAGHPVLGAAVEVGHAAVVELLLRTVSPELLNERNVDGMSALHIAVKHYKPDLVGMLLDAGADANVVGGQDGQTTPLQLCDDASIARLLLAKGADLHVANAQGEDALMLACGRGDGEMAALLVECQADVTAVNKSRLTALLIACEEEHFDLVPVLMRARAASTAWLDVQYGQGVAVGLTALCFAVQKDHAPAVQALANAGANLYLTGKYHGPPLRQARSLTVARVLLNAGVKDITSKTDMVGSALMRACGDGNLPMIRLLLEHKSDINAMSRHDTPLSFAASHGHVAVIKALLAAAPPALIDGRGHGVDTALQSAASYGQHLAIEALLAAGADPLLACRDGYTALMIASRPECVRVLVQAAPEAVNMANRRGETAALLWSQDKDKKKLNLLQTLLAVCKKHRIIVDVNKRNINGHSALDEALAVNNYDAMTLLLAHGAELGPMTIVQMLQRVRRSKNSDRYVNNCLCVVLDHALTTGSLERRRVRRVAESKDDDDDEEQPMPKRRRRM